MSVCSTLNACSHPSTRVHRPCQSASQTNSRHFDPTECIQHRTKTCRHR